MEVVILLVLHLGFLIREVEVNSSNSFEQEDHARKINSGEGTSSEEILTLQERVRKLEERNKLLIIETVWDFRSSNHSICNSLLTLYHFKSFNSSSSTTISILLSDEGSASSNNLRNSSMGT